MEDVEGASRCYDLAATSGKGTTESGTFQVATADGRRNASKMVAMGLTMPCLGGFGHGGANCDSTLDRWTSQPSLPPLGRVLAPRILHVDAASIQPVLLVLQRTIAHEFINAASLLIPAALASAQALS